MAIRRRRTDTLRDGQVMGRLGARVLTWLDEQGASRGWVWWPRWSALVPSLLGGVVTCFLLTFLFFLLADEIVEDGRLRLDLRLSRWVRAHDHPWLTSAMHVVTNLASTAVAIALWLVIVGWLVWQRRRRAAIIVAVMWPLGQGLVALIKVIYHRARPELAPGEVPFGGYSFPSGHTFTAVVTYGLLAALIAEQLPERARWIPWAGAALVIVGVGYSRVYLGAHYPVDVLGSLLLGGAWLRAMLLALSRAAPARSATGPIGSS
jgi:undecaprenyl-diphosphatase